MTTTAPRIFGATPMVGRHPDWERLYELVPSEKLPWHIGGLDPDLQRELDWRGIFRGTLLDVGTGAGQQAVALAQRGLTVTGADVSAAAIAVARRLPGGVRFVVDDILASGLTSTFDFVVDRGCLHVLPPAAWSRAERALARLVRPGGLLFLKCFSEAEAPANFGPERLCATTVARLFAPHFILESCTSTTFQGPLAHQPRALFAVLRREDPA
jgi:SAM-dependent methyltransferase